jgi:DNA-binding response OmpR family regulator
MRLLIIEDDPILRRHLKKALEAESFAVDVSGNGEDGYALARINDYDLIILDNILPKKTGLSVCQDIRSVGKDVCILMLSIKKTPADKAELLREGADDYLSKPFNFEELLARIHALLRRPRRVHADIVSIDTLTLNLQTKETSKGTKRIYFTRKEYSLFEYLMMNKGTIISRNTILEHVWDNDIDPFSNTVESHIRSLRKKIGTKKQPYIYNIPGRGYKIDSRL